MLLCARGLLEGRKGGGHTGRGGEDAEEGRGGEFHFDFECIQVSIYLFGKIKGILFGVEKII